MKKILTIAAFVFGGFLSSCDRTGTTSKAGSDLNANTSQQTKVDKNVQANATTPTDKCLGERSVSCNCPQVLKPVCGCNGVTYDNGCVANCEGVTSYTFGACPGTGASTGSGAVK